VTAVRSQFARPALDQAELRRGLACSPMFALHTAISDAGVAAWEPWKRQALLRSVQGRLRERSINAIIAARPKNNAVVSQTLRVCQRLTLNTVSVTSVSRP